MAIATLDEMVAGFLPPTPYFKYIVSNEAQNTHYFSHIYAAGFPGACAAPAPGINGAALTSYAGQIPFPAAVGGDTIYLASFTLSSDSTVVSTLCDRVWHNSGITSTTTTAQGITSGAMPARDLDGAVDGRGYMVALEVSTNTTNAGSISNTTLEYTNSAGTGSRTATMANFPATAVANTLVPFELQAGDIGIKSIQGITLGTSYGTGVIHIVVYRPIVTLFCSAGSTGDQLGPIELGFPKMFDNSVPFLISRAPTTSAKRIQGSFVFAQG